jgi:hypothetical protein
MATSNEMPQGKEPVTQSDRKDEAIRDLDPKHQADAVKGGRMIRKGGDPEEGGE